VRRLPHPCIIRFVDMRVEEKAVAMRESLNLSPFVGDQSGQNT